MNPFRVYEPGECSKDGYPFEWHKTVKRLVRERAGHRCVRCGHPYRTGESNPEWSACDEHCSHRGPVRLDGEPRDPLEYFTAGDCVRAGRRVEAARRVLTVHHLTGCWGRTREAKRDLRWWNLAALCQRCHLTIQGKVDMHRVYPWPHSEWFKPYAAGWYAHTYLGEDLTRLEAEARLDELLALELAA